MKLFQHVPKSALLLFLVVPLFGCANKDAEAPSGQAKVQRETVANASHSFNASSSTDAEDQGNAVLEKMKGEAAMSKTPAGTPRDVDASASSSTASKPLYQETRPASTAGLPAPAQSNWRRARGPATAFGGSGMAAGGSPATYNPNLYLSNTYMGGSGEKDRIEKLINDGVMVDGKRVKLEAFSRSYAQTFAIPTKTALNLVADTERSKIVRSGDHTYLQVGLQAIKGEQPRRPPLNIALVLDRSGSMQDADKLEFAKASACRLVDRLGADDYFSLIAFDDSCNVVYPSGKVTAKEAVKSRIRSIAPGGGTNIYDGLRLGYKEVHKHLQADGVNLVILLSDGEVTAGVSDPDSFYKMASAEADSDVQTTTVGLGMEFNEELMLSLAREGRGNYHFIKDGADTERVFAKELDELTHIVAKAVKLRIKLAEGVGFVRALGAAKLDEAQTKKVKADEKKIDKKVYEELGITANRQKDKDEPGIKLMIPSFYRGDSHVVMLEIAVPPGQGTRKLADVYVKYKDLVSRGNRETQVASTITYTADRGEMVASINKSVKKNLLGFQTGEAMKEAAALIEQGRASDAVKKIDERMVVLGLAAREWHDKDLDKDGALLDRYKNVLAQLSRNPALASTQYGDYLRKSLTYNGYQMTR